MIKLGKSVMAVLVMSVLIVGLSGCRPVERAGKQIDKAVEKAGQQVEKAGDKIEDAAKDAIKIAFAKRADLNCQRRPLWQSPN